MVKKSDQQLISFLQWALPRLGMRWPGFRKVRGQLRKRLKYRLSELGLDSLQQYREFLHAHQEEWSHLDCLCRITISRFFRDKGLFKAISETVLPDLAAQGKKHGRDLLRCWSCGCASGEEPYTLALIWRLSVTDIIPEMEIEILGTDADPLMLERAKAALYGPSSLKELPEKWRDEAFQEDQTAHFHLKKEYRDIVRFSEQDIRKTKPAGPFHLILCRNLAFTYFDNPTQEKVLAVFYDKLEPGGALVTGCHEKLPASFSTKFTPWLSLTGIFRKI